MSDQELPKVYNPKDFENKWFQFWTDKQYFHAEPDPNKTPYTIVIPPPNVTSQLHMGHGLNNTIQDILIRWQRMKGNNALWMPGTDHAGIATQNVVEKKLAKENKTRHDFSREEFIDEVWKWREQYGSIIIDQLKKMGCSCDWERERFTMDQGLSKAVREVFVRFYEDGLIYKGKYIVNWCPRCATALSQEEAEHKEIDGFFYHIKYPVKDEDRYLEVATTRPETMLGDTGVAVHPKDERYQDLIGKTLILPLLNREIPVVADEYTKMDFGTGAVKVTPAHDPNDFLIGQRHNLPQINVMNPDGTMNAEAGEQYKDLDRFECRKKVIADLSAQELLIKKEEHKHSVGHCYRCNTMVEPYLSDQWFVKMQPLAKEAIKVAKEDKITFYPEKWKKVYLHWLENIQDWCISRQIWWGHRIPVWECQDCQATLVSREDLSSCSQCGSANIEQDQDVLDTWFSSMLWPFSTLGWPEQNKDIEYFYPTNVLATAPEILFFWVARMIMAGLYFMKDIPYSQVYLNSTVRDQFGRKMSKSLGNGIDPLEVIDEHGADALRFTITSLAPMGLDIKLAFQSKNQEQPKGKKKQPEIKNDFLMGTRFANKIWNASRYILMNLKPDLVKDITDIKLDLADKWILNRLQETSKTVDKNLTIFHFNDTAHSLYDFIWHDFCDWYVELSKIKLYGDAREDQESATTILVYVLSEALKLLHPIMPYITEEIWQKLPHEGESIMIAPFPEFDERFVDKEAAENLALIQEIVYNTRNIRGEMNIAPEKKVNIIIQTSVSKISGLFSQYEAYIKSLGKVDSITIKDSYKPDAKCASSVGSQYGLFIPLEGLIDLEKEQARINKEIKKMENELEKTNKKLKNEKFLAKAAPEVIEKESFKLDEFTTNLEKLKKNLEALT